MFSNLSQSPIFTHGTKYNDLVLNSIIEEIIQIPSLGCLPPIHRDTSLVEIFVDVDYHPMISNSISVAVMHNDNRPYKEGLANCMHSMV